MWSDWELIKKIVINELICVYVDISCIYYNCVYIRMLNIRVLISTQGVTFTSHQYEISDVANGVILLLHSNIEHNHGYHIP